MSEGDQLALFLDILLALGLGTLVGLERELRRHEAGLRTIALVTTGAAVFGTVSSQFADADRVAAGVVTGIGFIGAGLIFQQGGGVKGLTTAATVWAMAGVGLLAALDLWLIAVLVTLVVIVVLESRPLVRALARRLEDVFEAEEG